MNKKDIQKLKKFVAKRNGLAVIGMILIEDGKATANNLETALQIDIERGPKPGCYAPEKLEAWLKGCEVEPDLPASEFPLPPEVKGELIALPRDFWSKMEKTEKCTSTDENRYILNGVCIDGDRMVGTNGRILASVDAGIDVEGRPIIPNKTIKAMAGLDPESMTVGKNSVSFSGPGWKVTSALICGHFPNWKEVVPKQQDGVDFDIPKFPAKPSMTPKALLAAIPKNCCVASFKDGKASYTDTKGNEFALGDTTCPEVLVNAAFLEIARGFTGKLNALPDESLYMTRLVHFGDDVTIVIMPFRRK